LGRGFVDEIDGLVGEEAIGDVAVGEHGGADERGVLDANAMMAARNARGGRAGWRSSPRRSADRQDRLEAALEGGVLLDVLAILVERRRTDAVQLAAGEHRLQEIARIHGALGGARADDGVELVDEEDDLALGRLNLLQHGFQALLELATYLAPATSAPMSSVITRLFFRPSGTSPRTMRCARPSTIAVLRPRARRSGPGCSWSGATAPG